MAKRGYFNNSF